MSFSCFSQDTLLLVRLVGWINENAAEIGLTVPLLFEDGSALEESLWLQQLSGTTKSRLYADGGYIGELPFAIYYRLPKTATDALGMEALSSPLWRIGNFLDARRPVLEIACVEDVRMTSTPSGFSRDDGAAVNQAIFKLIYSKGVY